MNSRRSPAFMASRLACRSSTVHDIGSLGAGGLRPPPPPTCLVVCPNSWGTFVLRSSTAWATSSTSGSTSLATSSSCVSPTPAPVNARATSAWRLVVVSSLRSLSVSLRSFSTATRFHSLKSCSVANVLKGSELSSGVGSRTTPGSISFSFAQLLCVAGRPLAGAPIEVGSSLTRLLWNPFPCAGGVDATLPVVAPVVSRPLR